MNVVVGSSATLSAVAVSGLPTDEELLQVALARGVDVWTEAPLEDLVVAEGRRALGVIAKRPVANAPWRFAERPVGDAIGEPVRIGHLVEGGCGGDADGSVGGNCVQVLGHA